MGDIYAQVIRASTAQLAERDAEIAELKAKLDAWVQVGDAIMECATGNPGMLSDSDVCGVISDLRAQVAQLQAWKDAVPVVGIKRLFRDAPYDASCADEVWQWISKMPK